MNTPDFAKAEAYLESNIFSVLDKVVGTHKEGPKALRDCMEYGKAAAREIQGHDETIRRLKERLERNAERTRDLQTEVNTLREEVRSISSKAFWGGLDLS